MPSRCQLRKASMYNPAQTIVLLPPHLHGQFCSHFLGRQSVCRIFPECLHRQIYKFIYLSSSVKKYLHNPFLCFEGKTAKAALSMIYLLKVFYQENTTETGLFLYTEALESSKFTYTKDRHPLLSLACLSWSPTLLFRSFVTELGARRPVVALSTRVRKQACP